MLILDDFDFSRLLDDIVVGAFEWLDSGHWLDALCLGDESLAVFLFEALSLSLNDSIIDAEGRWLVELCQYLLLLVEVVLETSNRELKELVLSLGLDNLVLQEFFVLLKGLRPGVEESDSVVHLLLVFLHLDLLLVELANGLLEVVDQLVFLGVVLVLLIQFIYQLFQFFLLLLHIDGVALEVIVLLLFEDSVKLLVEAIDHVLQVFLVRVDLLVFVDHSVFELGVSVQQATRIKRIDNGYEEFRVDGLWELTYPN